MADTFYFSRDTKVYLVQRTTASASAYIRWEIPVLDGFSFSQGTNTSEITLNEMQEHSTNKSRRSRQMFTDSYAPAEWSFSTYMRPFASSNGATGGWEANGSDDIHHSVEEPLWANFVAANTGAPSATSTEFAWADGVVGTTSGSTIDFTGSEKAELGTFDLYFEMGGAGSGTKTIYKIAGCCVNSASIDFDIDGIATINWSGFGKIISEESALPTSSTTIINEGVSGTGNFIRNRLTTLQAAGNAGGSSVTYGLTLTGGNITFENNISFLTPETLGVVNQPLGHVTGTRSVSGNFTCYLNAESNASADLFENIIEDTDQIVNDFSLTFNIGGASTPKVAITVPNAHLEVPTHSIDDIISIETNFHGLPASIDPDSNADNYEAKIVYTGA
jgi:hypothetical protein|tara:strand:+ start:480 stop:1649 length:1170 start_codon:yes stop_codon:yes gene_type:complete